ncbi:hypothetical protein [Streptomyces sp. NPDC059781]|uniref:hypothetical protein n=1 Tax=Streptomyces sp. NPDC059781 TaxID=3346943 RepID=UPI00365E3EF4
MSGVVVSTVPASPITVFRRTRFDDVFTGTVLLSVSKAVPPDAAYAIARGLPGTLVRPERAIG